MKKILFIIWSHSLGGGAEALLTMIVNHLDPCKYQIGIVEVYHSSIKKEPVNQNVRYYESITFEGDQEYEKKMYYIYREPDKIIAKYIPRNYDLYVSFNYQTPSFLLPEGKRNIAWVHTSVYDLAEDGVKDYWRLQNRAFGKAVKIISISDITTKSIQDLFPEHAEKIVEIYNAVDILEVKKRAHCFTDIVLEHPSIIYVGRMDENKNPLRMVDIFNKFAVENKSAHLYYLGSGQLEMQVRRRVREYGLENQVHFLGYLENPFPVIKKADISFVTSKSEGFPMRLLESVALHVPFVSTEVGGARILANEGHCGRVYITDEDAVKSIFDLLKLPKDLIKAECERSIRRFDLKTYISKIEHIFDEILEKPIVFQENEEWDDNKNDGLLKDRGYYYHFPEKLIPKGKKIILYGAGDVGTNYYHYIIENNYYQIVAWVDASAEKYKNRGKDVKGINSIMDMEYDVILIAVMHETIAQAIRRDLQMRGISNDKILWTKPIF